MPYFREMASKAIPPSSSSRTTSILKASLYRISSRLPCFFVFIPDNLFQDGTLWPFTRLPRLGGPSEPSLGSQTVEPPGPRFLQPCTRPSRGTPRSLPIVPP